LHASLNLKISIKLLENEPEDSERLTPFSVSWFADATIRKPSQYLGSMSASRDVADREWKS
jgi:hypothetical protein